MIHLTRVALMRKLCFGGSFNPIHVGHLICARAVAEAMGFERIVLIPSAAPPHKPHDKAMAFPEHRLTMCRIAVEGDGQFEVDDIELRRSGPSYTVDTVRELKARGWGKVSWLIGADMLATLPEWYEPEMLVREARLIVMTRPGSEINLNALPTWCRPADRDVVEAPLIQISASQVRERLARGQSVRWMIPPGVEEYIRQRGLYGARDVVVAK